MLGPPHPGDESGTLGAPERLCVCVCVHVCACVRQAFDSNSVTSSPNPGTGWHLPPLGEALGDLGTLRALLVSALLLLLPTFPPCSLSSFSPSSKKRTHIRCFCYQTRSYVRAIWGRGWRETVQAFSFELHTSSCISGLFVCDQMGCKLHIPD